MGFHHVAIATRDPEATHRFYTDVMGFELVKTEAAPAPEGGWARHLFYDTGDGTCIAFWDVHDDPVIDPGFDPSISRGLGLPSWTNHLAFDAHDLDALGRMQEHWRAQGHDVLRIDHGWCTSIYLEDPNGITVELCCTTRSFTDVDRVEAEEMRKAAMPPIAETPPAAEVFEATSTPVG